MPQNKGPTEHNHDASDRALDQAAFSELSEQAEKESKGPGHDEAEVRAHNDKGRDRLFEGREQHDEADKNQEKNRLARDVARHNHDVDPNVADSGTSHTAKHKG